MSLPEDEAPPGVPEWVVTYGDMMSLLLTFFIMLVSMSEIKDEGKLRAMMDALVERFGPDLGSAGVPGPSHQKTSEFDKRSSRGVRSEGGTKKASRKSEGQAGAHKTVQRVNHGTVVTMGGPTLFAPFDATLTEPLKHNLDIIVEVVSRKPNRLMVRGHSSPEPLPIDFHKEFHGIEVRDQWDLSFARAHAVAEYLVSKGVKRDRLVVSAAADTEPRTRTRDRASQALNRRVDVFLIDAYITPENSNDGQNP